MFLLNLHNHCKAEFADTFIDVNLLYFIARTMTHQFEPFTPEAFRQQTGMNAFENEAVYIRWVNTQINYANYLQMQSMNASLKEIIGLLKEGVLMNVPKL